MKRTFLYVVIAGAVLTQEEIDQLMGKLESVTSILQEREKARLKETKVSNKIVNSESYTLNQDNRLMLSEASRTCV